MSDDYTPTTDEVRIRFQRDIARNRADGYPDPRVSEAEFNRWLAAHDAAVRADHEKAVRERIAQDILAEEPKIRGYVDFDRHREDCIGQINGLRRAARITREGA